MLTDKLKQLSQSGQPQTLDELFQSSKEGMMSDRVVAKINAILPAMEKRIIESVKSAVSDEIKNQVGAIKVRDGRDGKDGRPGLDGRDGKDGLPGKDASLNEEELLAKIMSKIPRGKRGGGGSTMRVDNLSSQTNGSTKTFTTTHKIGSAHLLFYSSFPSFFLPTTDYSVSGNTITLGASVDAPVSGQSLAIFYESAD